MTKATPASTSVGAAPYPFHESLLPDTCPYFDLVREVARKPPALPLEPKSYRFVPNTSFRGSLELRVECEASTGASR